MHFIKKIKDDLIWVGANDRRLAMFEGVYHVPDGVSYNSYFLDDEKTVLFDTVDKAVRQQFLENIDYVLNGRALDYLIVQHMEPDHSAIICELAQRFPHMKIVCNQKTVAFIKQFHDFDIDARAHVVTEQDTLVTGKHKLHFVMAPMVHWPEVMVTYDSTDKILFSADAFGCFGALNGAIFADEVDFDRDYMDEARRYYTNIVGKYGPQVTTLLEKAAGLDIDMICPLHGFVWRNNLNRFISKYLLWGSYTPEQQGVMIAYASIYGHTENAAEILSGSLREKGIKTVMYDVSVTPASEIVAAAFKWSHLVFASATYNAGIFITMEALVNDLTAHNIQNRTVAFIENGSWAATSGGLMREKFNKCSNINFIENVISLKSSLKPNQLDDIKTMADSIAKSLQTDSGTAASVDLVNNNVMFNISYGLYIITTKDGTKDNGCVVNTITQISENPNRIALSVNNANFTCGTILKTGQFNVSILTQTVPFSIFERFGFKSGKDTEKLAGFDGFARGENGIIYLTAHTNGVISAKIIDSLDYGTHTLFIAEVTQSFIQSEEPSVTYQYYFDHIKPKPQLPKEKLQGFICKICGYIYEGDVLPKDFICPLCKHGAEDFLPL